MITAQRQLNSVLSDSDKKFLLQRVAILDKQINKWTLKDYIDVAKELGYIDLDVQKFSHVLQNFRNYIHPYQQMQEKFSPNIDTAKLCVQVVKIAINQIGDLKHNTRTN